MEKLESIKRKSSKKTISVSKRLLLFSLFTSPMCEVGLENSTCGVGTADNQGKQSIKVYIGIAPTFHRMGSANVFL